MSSKDPILALVLLVIVAGALLLPVILLRLKSAIRNGKKSIFSTVGTLRGLKLAFSMVPTHRFDIFLDGLLISGLFRKQFISAKNIRSATQTKSWLKSYIKLELKSGKCFYIATTNTKLLGYLEQFL